MNRRVLAVLVAIVALAAVIAVIAMSMNNSDTGSSMPGMTMPGGSTSPESEMTTP